MRASVYFRWLLCGLVFLCFFPHVRALDPDRLPSQYVREVWNAETGFSGGAVHAIAQTHDGYLWIGTDHGLLSFDGFNFRTASSSGPVLGLTTDANGNLLVRLEGAVLLRQPSGKFESVDSGLGVTASHVTAMWGEPSGGVLISDLLTGLLRFRERKLEVLVHRNALTGPPVVISVAKTSDGKIWMGTLGAGLLYLSEGRVGSVAAAQIPDRKINCMLPDSDNQLWIGTDRGLLRWNGTEVVPAALPGALEHAQILSLLRDRNSNVWAATERGLLRINVKGISLSAENEVRGGGVLHTMFEDREGNLWVGGARGLERIRDSAFVTYSQETGLPSEGNGAIFADTENRIWSSPAEGGLYVLGNGRVERISVAGLTQDVVYSIAGKKGEVWLGRQHGGLTRMRYEGGVVTSQTFTKKNGLAQNSVYAVHLGRDGTVWAGTLSGGVSRFKDDRFITYAAGSGLPSNTVNSILETRDGAVWFATPDGLASLSAGSWKTYTSQDGLPSDTVNSLLEDVRGVLWIATDKGIAFLHSGKIQIPREMPAPLNEPIFGIEQDTKGSLWIAAAHHVVKVNRDGLMGLGNEMEWREYGRSDGLESTEGVKRQKSVIIDALGRIWFSMSRGLSVIDPSRVPGNSASAIAHVESVLADGSPVGLAEPVRVPSSPRRITLVYTGLSLAAPERVRFRYRLDGFDRSWSEPTASREAVYTNLGPGAYRFRVMACNNSGVWNEAGTILDFSILPAYYQTAWFRASCAAAFLLLLWAIYRFRVQQLERQFAMALEARVSERSRIARELHDTLLQSIHGLLFRFQAARNMLPRRPEEAMQALDGVIGRTEQAIAEGRSAIQNLRSAPTTPGVLADVLTSTAKDLASEVENPPSFRVIVEGERRPLAETFQREVGVITRELLQNAFQHARARQIEAEIRYDESELRLRIRDDGRGIDPKVLEEGGRRGHWGLQGVRERAQEIGAQLDFWSEAGAGTEIQIAVPANIAYGKSQDSSRFRLLRKAKSHEQS
jgi:ligand-binding sensor domain-containing protein/signal transduction histidine kinase